jgi:DNA helicase-2/ATP-dependent DNA helicase PcrA
VAFELNAQQKAAVNAPLDKAARVLAGPGSGKTVVIEYRLEFLLDHGVDPKHIIVVTFSRPMADEMLRRIIKLCPEIAGTALERRITTIHALLFRLLRAEGETRKVAKTWQIKKAIEEAAEAEDLDEGWKVIQSWIDSAKAHCVREGEDEPWFRERLVAAGAPVFERAMRSQGLLTFADMLYLTELLFEDSPAVLKKWQGWTEHVLVDEGQDTGGQAMRILTALAAPQDNFYIVGDSDQLLYRFAGATPEANLAQGFEQRYPDGLTFKLETNYRSSQAIVASINQLISNNYGQHNEHLHKTLVAPSSRVSRSSCRTAGFPETTSWEAGRGRSWRGWRVRW